MGQFDLKKYAEEANKIWNGEYEYVKYIPGFKKDGKKAQGLVEIVCHKKDKYGREHGHFWKNPTKHKQGQGCPKCSIKNRTKKSVLSLNTFIKRANIIHNNKYDYDLLYFKNLHSKIKINCPKHGYFEQIA